MHFNGKLAKCCTHTHIQTHTCYTHFPIETRFNIKNRSSYITKFQLQLKKRIGYLELLTMKSSMLKFCNLQGIDLSSKYIMYIHLVLQLVSFLWAI